MSYETPAWAANNGSQNAGEENRQQTTDHHQTILIDVREFVRTRDALTSAYIGLSSAVDRAVKAYLDHTSVVLNGGASLNMSGMLAPLHHTLGSNIMLAQQAYQNAGMPMQQQMAPNGAALIDGQKPKRAKRAYKQRDRNAPKRPLTAYFRFLGEQRPEIQAECAANPTMVDGKPGDISKIATDRWNSLSKEQQQPYRDAYQKALKDYHREVVAYKASIGEEVPDSMKELLRSEKTEVDEGTTAGAVGMNDNDGLVDDDDDSDSSSSSDSDDEEEVATLPPPPPPPAAKTPRSGHKKNAQSGMPTPKVFNSIDAEPKSDPAVSSSGLKRKSPSKEKEETGRKSKKSRKSVVSATAGPDVSPAPASDSAVPSFSPEATQVEPASKKKEKKKKRRDA